MFEIDYLPASATALVHPMEHETMLSVQKNGLFDHVVQTIGSLTLQLGSLPKMMLEAFAVNAQTYPRLHRIYQETLQRLECEETFRLFVDFGYELTAHSYGSAQNGHIIVVNSACLRELNDGELAALLGREIGHIQNRHIQYREMMDSFQLLADHLPAAGEAVKEKLASFFARWMIASEFTADRAGLMACRSYEHMACLLLRQAGIAPTRENALRLLKQKTDPLPSRMGVSYMLMAGAFPAIGMVARLQELDRWVQSDALRSRYPFMHYMAKAWLDREERDETEQALILLHRRAANGHTPSQLRLAEGYLLGKETLPKATEPYLALIQSAACSGDGKAMYALYRVFEKNPDVLRASPRLKEQLLRAAASRYAPAREAASHLPSPSAFVLLPRAVSAFAQKYGHGAKCHMNLSHPGQPLQGELADEIRDLFWMPANEKVYAAQLETSSGQTFGVALGACGIYGKLPRKRFPYRISWHEYTEGALNVMHENSAQTLALGKQKIAPWTGREEMKGSVAEILLTMKKTCKKQEAENR